MDDTEATATATLGERIVSHCKEGHLETLREFYICLVTEAIVSKPIILKATVDKKMTVLIIKRGGAHLKVNGDVPKMITHGRMKSYLSKRDEENFEAKIVYEIMEAFWHNKKGRQKRGSLKVTLEEQYSCS